MTLPIRRRPPTASLVSAVILLASTAAAAAGQDKPQKPVDIATIEVVATRIPEAPHDVPASIDVISGADLRARGAATLKDALTLSAGISIAPGGDNGPAGAVPEFWGLREFDAFLLVVDDVPWGGAFNPALATLSLLDVERIEVLRGPAPVTYGATSFVGVIHVVHNAAAANTRYVSAHGGSFGSGGVSVDLPVPFSEKWKSRLSADLNKEGFKDNHTSYQGGHALWRVSNIEGANKTWITADLNMLRQDPASPFPREGPALSTQTPLDANHNPAGAYLNEDRFALSAGLERSVFDGATWGTVASFTHSSKRVFRGFLTDISNTPDNASGFKENIDVSDLYVDTHIIWPTRSDLKFMTGADLLYGTGDAAGATFNYTAPLSGASQAAIAEPSNLGLDTKDRRTFLGAYASAEWRPSARFSASAGVRYNATTETANDDNAVTNSRLSGSLGALFGVWESGANHVRLFANYRDTFKPAAFDFGLGDAGGVLEPETSRSYEGGVKIRTMDGRFDIEASYFHMDFENLVTSAIVNNQPALVNAGKSRFMGFEIETDMKLSDATWARATFSSHDAKFVDFLKDFGDGTLTQLGGKRIEMSASQLWAIGITHSPDDGFIASASVSYTGDRFMNQRNTAPVPGFATYDAGIGWRTGRVEFRLDGRNLGIARDVVSESEFGDAQYYRMPAMTFRLGMVVKY